MAVVSAQKIQEISQSDDPARAILKAVGDLSKEEVLGDLVLVGVYIRPEKTKGGIYRPQENIREDEFQGKVGMVLKAGPLAFADWEPDDFKGQWAKSGTWVVYAVKDGWSVTINETPCRLVPYERLRMKLSRPEVVF